MKRLLVLLALIVVVAAMLLSACAAPVTISPTPTPVPSITEGIDPRTGTYGNYYLGLVKEPTGIQVDS